MADGYHYTLELYTRAGASLGRLPLAADFEPAREWTLFEAIRRGELSPAADVHPGPLHVALSDGDVEGVADGMSELSHRRAPKMKCGRGCAGRPRRSGV